MPLGEESETGDGAGGTRKRGIVTLVCIHHHARHLDGTEHLFSTIAIRFLVESHSQFPIDAVGHHIRAESTLSQNVIKQVLAEARARATAIAVRKVRAKASRRAGVRARVREEKDGVASTTVC